MTMLAVRREVRRRMREAHIADLEHGVGISLSYPASQLPTIKVMRNPSGEWMMGDRWIALGFGGYPNVEAATKRRCVKRAQRRLRAMMQARVEPETVVTP